MVGVVGRWYSLSIYRCWYLFRYVLCFLGVDEVVLVTFDIILSHSCACMRIAIAIVCACVGSVLYARVSGGFSLKNTICAISARVRVWKLLVLFTTMGMI